MALKILVSVKRVIDFNVKIRVKSDLSGVETQNIKMSMNPFDEIAVTEAVTLKQQNKASELIVISLGPDSCQETLRMALAMGMDRAIHIKTETEFEPINVAKIFKEIVSKEKPDLIIMGKQAIDDDCNQTGQMLAALLNWPQGTFASRVQVADQTVRVTREVDGGLETLELMLPAVVTTDLRLNTPPFISLPSIMKAKQKPLEIVPLELLSLSLPPHLKTLKIEPPPPKKSGIMVHSVKELVEKLHDEARVI